MPGHGGGQVGGLSSTMLVVPRLYEVTPVRSTDEVISDVPMTRLRRGPFRSPMWKLKRVVDMLVSGIAILLLSPLLAILALVDRIAGALGLDAVVSAGTSAHYTASGDALTVYTPTPLACAEAIVLVRRAAVTS